MVAAGLVFLISLGFMAAPYVAPLDRGAGPVFFWIGVAGVLLSLVLGLLATYRKTSANEALVKTGFGGHKVVLDGGIFVFPRLHQLVPVSLETMKLEVERQGPDALITHDNLRVDVKGEFYIKVAPNESAILNAARSLGHKSVDAGSVSKLVFEKLVSALRSVAAQKDLNEIHSNRVEFASAVQEIVSGDLVHNGLTLETVTISRLDQTDPHGLSDENIFDAQGKKKITEITAQARVERNRLEKDAERLITGQNVTTAQEVLALERQKAEAQATQERDVAMIQAERAKERQAFQIEQDRAVREAEIQKELAIQAAAIERDKALITREQERQRTDIERAQAIEVAERMKQIAVAQQETARAQAEAEALDAAAERERANQSVITVQATAAADREAQTKLIGAKQVIEQDKIKRQTEAEVAAFAEIRKAEAELKAAESQAAARLQLAEAEAQAKQRVATGEQAQKLVDVNVEREKVNVEQARVEVERKALENRQTFDRAAIEFETAKLRIEADKDVQIALAQALGQFVSRGNYNIYGDPNTMTQMFQQMTKGMGVSLAADGMLRTLPEPLRNLLNSLGSNAEEAVAALIARDGNGKPAAVEAAPAPAAETAGDEEVTR